MRYPGRVRFSLKGIFLMILALSAGLAILRLTNFNLHHAIGLAASILGTAFLIFLAVLYFFDLVDITTWAMRAWEKRNHTKDHRDSP